MRHAYTVPPTFARGREAQEVLMMAQCVWALRETLRRDTPFADDVQVLQTLAAMEELQEEVAAVVSIAGMDSRDPPRPPSAASSPPSPSALSDPLTAAWIATDLDDALSEAIRSVLTMYNTHVRLRLRPCASSSSSPPTDACGRDVKGSCREVGRRERAGPSPSWPATLNGFPHASLMHRPQTPCEIVDEAAAWWAWGANSVGVAVGPPDQEPHGRASAAGSSEGEPAGCGPAGWLGHGMWWRSTLSRPDITRTSGFAVDNTAGNSLFDFDLLEDNFVRLRRASVVVADYSALRRDFFQQRGPPTSTRTRTAVTHPTPAELDRFLLDHAAFMSEGQAARIFGDDGDHFGMLFGGDGAAATSDESLDAAHHPHQREESARQGARPVPSEGHGGYTRGTGVHPSRASSHAATATSDNLDPSKQRPQLQQEYLDGERRRAGIRMRSGGRAASFFIDNTYFFDAADPAAGLQARFLEVKGVGTSLHSGLPEAPRMTGLLTMADALKEFAVQRLLQRLLDLDQATTRARGGSYRDTSDPTTPGGTCTHDDDNDARAVGTVPCYAIIDTGFRYHGRNPATGWRDETVVLLVRGAHNRVLDSYEAVSFAGMLTESVGKLAGPGRRARRVLLEHGVSAEFFPRALVTVPPTHFGDRGYRRTLEDERAPRTSPSSVVPYLTRLLADLDGQWNLQMDARMDRLVDFTDYYVLPAQFAAAAAPPCPALARWRMSDAAVRAAVTLENNRVARAFLSTAGRRRYYAAAAVAGISCEGEGGEVVGAPPAETSTPGPVSGTSAGGGRSDGMPMPTEGARDDPRGHPCLDLDACLALRAHRLSRLSEAPHIRAAAAKVCPNTGVVISGKPELCMNWFMELDDSEVAGWIHRVCDAYKTAVDAASGFDGAVVIMQPLSGWMAEIGAE